MRRNTAWQYKKDQNLKVLWESKHLTEIGECTFFPETHPYFKDEYSSLPNPLVPFENDPEYKIILQGKTFDLEKNSGIQEVLRSSLQRSTHRSVFKKHPIAESLVAD